MKPKTPIVITNTLDELLHAPEEAVIEAPLSVWDEAGVDVDERVGD